MVAQEDCFSGLISAETWTWAVGLSSFLNVVSEVSSLKTVAREKGLPFAEVFLKAPALTKLRIFLQQLISGSVLGGVCAGETSLLRIGAVLISANAFLLIAVLAAACYDEKRLKLRTVGRFVYVAVLLYSADVAWSYGRHFVKNVQPDSVAGETLGHPAQSVEITA